MKAKLEHSVLDLFDDHSADKTLMKIACNLSNDLKHEPLPSVQDRNRLEDFQFALTLITKTASKLNKYPLDSKINTALSNEYFHLNHHKLPEEAQKIAAAHIVKACDKYGIDAHQSVKIASLGEMPRTNIYVETIEKNLPLLKQASTYDSSHYALGSRYAIPDEKYLRKAEQYFDKHAAKFVPADRHEFARNVSIRAETLGIKTASVLIDTYAGKEYNPNLEGHLKMRTALLDEDSPYIPALQKLASYKSSEDPETFAKVLHEIDKKAGLDRYYDRSLADPYVSTFSSGMSKSAGYVYEKDGIYLTSEDVEKVARDKYDVLKNYFGQTLADGLKKEGVSAFEALPVDAKDIVARISNGEIQ